MRLIYSDAEPLPLPPGHRFPASKYPLVREQLAREHAGLLLHADQADWDDLALVHTPEYLDAWRSGDVPPPAERRLGFPFSPALRERARRSTGGTVVATYWALEHGAAGHLAGGTHHAFADRGEGYCVFNDLAVAARVARRDRGVRRVAFVDLDVHQGNGTAALFRGDPDALTVSLHGERNYPFHKEHGSLDIGLPDGCDDARFLRELSAALERVEAFRPELVYYQAGVDGLAGDRLGRLALTLDGLAARDRAVYALARRLAVPLVVTLGGGYGRDLATTVAGHVNVYRGLVRELG